MGFLASRGHASKRCSKITRANVDMSRIVAAVVTALAAFMATFPHLPVSFDTGIFSTAFARTVDFCNERSRYIWVFPPPPVPPSMWLLLERERFSPSTTFRATNEKSLHCTAGVCERTSSSRFRGTEHCRFRGHKAACSENRRVASVRTPLGTTTEAPKHRFAQRQPLGELTGVGGSLEPSNARGDALGGSGEHTQHRRAQPEEFCQLLWPLLAHTAV